MRNAKRLGFPAIAGTGHTRYTVHGSAHQAPARGRRTVGARHRARLCDGRAPRIHTQPIAFGFGIRGHERQRGAHGCERRRRPRRDMLARSRRRRIVYLGRRGLLPLRGDTGLRSVERQC